MLTLDWYAVKSRGAEKARMEDRGWMIAILYPPSSILNE